jgi:hypothetical protein
LLVFSTLLFRDYEYSTQFINIGLYKKELLIIKIALQGLTFFLQKVFNKKWTLQNNEKHELPVLP